MPSHNTDGKVTQLPGTERRKPGPKKGVPWDKIEIGYRQGVSFGILANKYGVRKQTIHGRAKKEGWARDLSAKAQELARTKAVMPDFFTEPIQPVSDGIDHNPDDSHTREERERLAIEASAEAMVKVIREHRGDLALLRERETKIAVAVDIKIDILEALAVACRAQMDAAADGDDPAAVAQAMIGASALIDNKTLAGTLKALNMIANIQQKRIPLERRAYGMDEDNKGQNPDEDFTKEDQEIIDNALKELAASQV